MSSWRLGWPGFWAIGAVALGSLLLGACSPADAPLAGEATPPGALVVALPLDPVFYQPGESGGGGGAEGFAYEVVNLFAGELRRNLRVVPVRTAAEMQRLVNARLVDFAAGFPVEEANGLAYTQALQSGAPVIVAGAGAGALSLNKPEDLSGRVVEVAGGSWQKGFLTRRAGGAKIQEVPVANDIELLARVADGQAALAFSDALHLSVAANFYPDLDAALELPGKIDYAWAFGRHNEPLRVQADAFINRLRLDGTLARIRDQYFGHIERVNAGDMAQFLTYMRTRLPRFRAHFHEAQLLTGIDWRLLAALAYQESMWDPLATSFTGVRGMMMLTEDTADRLRVSNRLDPRESITAGARYLADLLDMNKVAPEPDRVWLALSAYNLGPGHFNAARMIARSLKRDPTSWYEMKKVLPLLSRPAYYERLKSGKARGGEAVVMVENIRNFFAVLSRFEAAYVPVMGIR